MSPILRRAIAVVSIGMAAHVCAAPGFERVGTYTTGLASIDDETTSGETAAVSGDRLYVTNATDISLDVVSIADPTMPTLLRRVDLSAYGSSVTSVDVSSTGLVAVALVGSDKTKRGTIVFLDRTGDTVAASKVWRLPDMVTFTPDGKRLLVANEGEPDCYGTGCFDPRGLISIIEVEPLKHNPQVRHLGFNKVGASLPAGVRIFGPGASPGKDIEPEYITVSDDSAMAWITLQENNAIAELDLQRLKITRVIALGTKDHGVDGAGLDASDRDDTINIQPWARVRGMYMPDAIAQFTVDGTTYLVTANEGDARDYPHPTDPDQDFSEESRAEDLAGEAGLADIMGIADETMLGRLTVTLHPPEGDTGNLYAFGARSFSIWDAASGAQVWDSGDELEQLIATELPDFFNSTNDDNDSFDNRSDNKGPEPEGVAIGMVGDVRYAFVGLERIGGVAVYDLTDPQQPAFAEFLINRSFNDAAVGPDSGPEILRFVDADESPNGEPMLVVANEITGTVSLWQPAQ